MQKRKLKLSKKGYPFGDPLMRALGRVDYLEKALQGEMQFAEFQRNKIRELEEQIERLGKLADDLTREKHELQRDLIKAKRRYVSVDSFI